MEVKDYYEATGYLAAFSLTFLIGGSESKAVSETEDVADVGRVVNEERTLVEINETEKVAEESGKVAELADEAQAIEEIGKVGKVAESGKLAGEAERMAELAADPAHNNSTRAWDIIKGKHEAEVGLSLERQGKLTDIIRDPTGKAEFIEKNGIGQKWDIKSFNSNYPPRKGGFQLEKALNTIEKELSVGENVIVDTTSMSEEHINSLIEAINKLGLDNKIIFWP